VIDKPSFLQRLNITWLLFAALIILITDPLGILNGNFSQDSYSLMRNELSKTNDAKVLLMGSWDDFYSLEYNNFWRKEVSAEFVERNYDDVLNAASLGDEFFNRFLFSNGVTHILVPQSTFNNGIIRHKYSNRGSIEIQLGDPYFETSSATSGPYAAVLLRAKRPLNLISDGGDPSYQIYWRNVDWWFYTKQTKITEVGLYGYSYQPFYDSGPDVSWFYDLSPERSNDLEIRFESKSNSLQLVKAEITLVAAYGPNAPPHIVTVSTAASTETKTLIAGNPSEFQVNLSAGDTVNIKSNTPCRLPSTFAPTDQSPFKICFGVSKVLIFPENQVE
jgi:hypothetical protein